MDTTLKELSLKKEMRFPIDKYNSLIIAAFPTVIRLTSETEEEFFVRTHAKMREMFNACAAIEMAEIMRITNNGSLAEYAYSLGDSLGANNNRFVNKYLNTFKEKENQ
uniref:Uncharacterized protein n=1 Tax=viral metagenome TaxID=1070528 RepID=A0A6H1ZD98_9ZZZZ